jgi:hypothetical protein
MSGGDFTTQIGANVTSKNPWTAMAAELVVEPGWKLLTDYCQARENNLRDRAATIAEEIVVVARDWPFKERKRFSLWLARFTGSASERSGLSKYSSRFSTGGPGLFAPRRVVHGVLLPTFVEWSAKEPSNPEPHYWLGLYGEDPGPCLRQAISLDPTHGPARAVLAGMVLEAVKYAQHELPSGYLGDPIDDLGSLNEAKALLTEAIEPSVRLPLEEKVSILEATARDWIKLRDQFNKGEHSWTERLSIWRARTQGPVAPNL